jgi:arginine N-succinyltransferase
MVDIFEGGPIVSCATDEIRTVRESRATMVHKVTAGPIESDLFILSNTYANGYRACAGTLAIAPGKGIQISKETAAALRVKKGDPVRIAPLRPGTGKEIL